MDNKLPVAIASSCIKTDSLTTTGGSFIGVTLIDKFPVAVPPFGSVTVYVIAGRLPKYPSSGVKVYVPFAFTIKVPTFGISTILPAV